MPLDQQPIGRQAAMKRAGRDSVQIAMIFPAHGAKPVQIEVRVAEFERIECPLNEPDSAAQRLLALKKFEHAANATVPVFAVHSRHVGMQVGHAASQASDRERIAHQAVAGECTQRLAAGMRSNHKHGGRLNFQVGFSPDPSLEFDATMELLDPFALSNNNLLAHGFAGVPFAAGNFGFPSDFFAFSQNSSISSRGRSLNCRPFFRASASMERNRRENFALAFLSAISGSIFKNRERFTAANSKSPSSSSIFGWSCSLNAFFSSSVSSRIFSKTPPASSQSKPMREALRVS